MSTDEEELLIALGDARDQGPRPTCLSFSISEIHRSAIGHDELLSPASLHCRATQRALKSADAGLTISEAADTLTQDGQTTEVAWPYDAAAPIQTDCEYHHADMLCFAFSAETISDLLRAGQPVSLILDIDMSFFSCNGAAPVDLISGSQIQGRHAVVICGLRKSPSDTVYLIKNSWGKRWGDSGYAWLTGKYVTGRSPQLIRI